MGKQIPPPWLGVENLIPTPWLQGVEKTFSLDVNSGTYLNTIPRIFIEYVPYHFQNTMYNDWLFIQQHKLCRKTLYGDLLFNERPCIDADEVELKCIVISRWKQNRRFIFVVIHVHIFVYKKLGSEMSTQFLSDFLSNCDKCYFQCIQTQGLLEKTYFSFLYTYNSSTRFLNFEINLSSFWEICA